MVTNAAWFLLVGGLLLAVGLTASAIRQLPVTPAMVYLAVGILIGPTVLDVFHFNPLKEAPLLELLTEGAVLISLFSAGLKTPAPFSLARWRTPLLLAFVSMALTVGMVAVFAASVLGLPLGAAVLLGAIVAPTDPVLATEVQIRHPGDRDRLRFALTSEAGMNDGSAFPFVMLGMGLLGLHDLGSLGLRWALVDVLWATVGAIALGVVGGALVGRFVWMLRNGTRQLTILEDLVGLGLIGVVYGASVLAHTWGFLAVFFAAVSLRQTEVAMDAARTPVDRSQDSAAPPRGGAGAPEAAPHQSLSEGSLIFKEHLERLSEVVLIILIGGTLFLDSWSVRGVTFALFLFVVARPVSVLISLLPSRAPWRIRGMTAWFGVRGIGSLYYLMYAIQHGLPEELALELIHLVLIVVALSIVVHGISVKPAMGRFWPRGRRESV